MQLVDPHKMQLFEAGRIQFVLVCMCSWLEGKLVVLVESEEKAAELRSFLLLLDICCGWGTYRCCDC